MPKRPQSARASSSARDSAPTSGVMVYRMHSARRSIPTHRHLLKEAVQMRSQSARETTTRPGASSLLLDSPPFGPSKASPEGSRVRPQSAHVFSSSSRNTASPIASRTPARPHSSKSRKSRRASTSLAIHCTSPKASSSSSLSHSSSRPQSANARHLHQPSSSMTGFHNLFRRNHSNASPSSVPTSWTETSRKRESLSMIELSLAENLKLLSSSTPITERELFRDYVSVYEAAFDRVLEVLSNSELYGILKRIKHAYHRVWVLLADMNAHALNSTPSNQPSSTPQHRHSSLASPSTPQSHSQARKHNYSSNHTHSSQEDQTLSALLQETEQEVQSLRESNQKLHHKLHHNAQLLQFYAKKWNENKSTTQALQGLSDQEMLLMRMNQIELEVDSHIYDIPLTESRYVSDMEPARQNFFPSPHEHSTPTSNTHNDASKTDTCATTDRPTHLPSDTNLTPAQLQNQRREILQKELEEKKLRVMDIERELQALENDDFFESMGIQEGDRIDIDQPAQECSLRDRVLQQVRETKKGHSGGIEISRGTQAKRNHGKTTLAHDTTAKQRSLH
mmetsp:Transcript_3037/g.11669  ORF Transcript_3037/g.11669 Transcript_3037/m.11669 type:complete len:565 (-) Transcript_3037:1698-3392(-)